MSFVFAEDKRQRASTTFAFHEAFFGAKSQHNFRRFISILGRLPFEAISVVAISFLIALPKLATPYLKLSSTAGEATSQRKFHVLLKLQAIVSDNKRQLTFAAYNEINLGKKKKKYEEGEKKGKK